MKTKSDIAREMLAAGQKPSEVAAMLGVTLQFIYNMRARDKRKAKRQQINAIKADVKKQPDKAKRKVGRPKGSKDKQPRKVPNNKTDLQKLRKAVDGITPPVKKEGEPVAYGIHYVGNPRPNLWARIKAVFTGRYE
jgi:hypothetical protein